MTDKPPAGAPAGKSIPPDWWPHPAEEPSRRFWQLDRGDQRVLWITIAGTFIGGVASIVIGAVVVGISLALARQTRQEHVQSVLAPLTWGSAIVAGLSMAAARTIKQWTPGRFYPVKVFFGAGRAVSIWVAFTAAVLLGEMLLIWIGIAAGIK